MVLVMVVMMTLKMILGNSWVSEKEEDNKALSVVEYSYNRQKKALVKTLKRHERHVPSCWSGVRTSLIQSTPHSRLVSPAGETIRALRKSDSEYKGGGENKKKVEQRKRNKVFRLTQRKPSMAPRENMPTKEIRGVFMTHKFLYLLFTPGRFHWCFGVRIGEKPTLVFHLIRTLINSIDKKCAVFLKSIGAPIQLISELIC